MKATEVKPEVNIQQILNKQNNPVFQSHYFHNSVKIDDNPEVVHTFFHDHPLQKYQKDITVYRPVSYQSPSKQVIERNYIVVEEKVTYGKPLSVQEFQRLTKTTKQPEIITYGIQQFKEEKKIKDGGRVNLQVAKQKTETKSGWCCCAGPSTQGKPLVQKYE